MKRLFLFASALFLAGIVSHAQTQKGYYLIGGTIGGLGTNLQKGGSDFYLNITPKAAWFIQDNLAIGGQVGLGYRTQKDLGNRFEYSIGPLARYYFGDAEIEKVKINAPKPVRFFAEANAGVAGILTNPPGSDTKAVSTNGFDFGVGPGVAFFVNENIALEALAKYNMNLGFGSTPIRNGLHLGVGFQIFLPGSRLKELRNEVN